MDVAKQFGKSLADLEHVFAAHPQAGFCLDVAHVWTNDRSLQLGHDLLDAFADRLRQLHVSGIEPDPRAAEKGRDIMIGRDLMAHPDFGVRERYFPGTIPDAI